MENFYDKKKGCCQLCQPLLKAERLSGFELREAALLATEPAEHYPTLDVSDCPSAYIWLPLRQTLCVGFSRVKHIHSFWR